MQSIYLQRAIPAVVVNVKWFYTVQLTLERIVFYATVNVIS